VKDECNVALALVLSIPGPMMDVIHIIEGASQKLRTPRVTRFEWRHQTQSP